MKFKQLKQIDAIYGKLLADEKYKQTKIVYALKRFSEKNLVKMFGDYNKELEDIRIDNALTDKDTQAILYEEKGGSYKYSKEGLKAVLKKIREVSEEWNEKEFEVEPFICKEIPKGLILEEDELEVLEGVILEKTSSLDAI